MYVTFSCSFSNRDFVKIGKNKDEQFSEKFKRSVTNLRTKISERKELDGIFVFKMLKKTFGSVHLNLVD